MVYDASEQSRAYPTQTSQTLSNQIGPGLPLELAFGDESDFLCLGEEY